MTTRHAIRKKGRERFLVESFARSSRMDMKVVAETEPPDFIVEFEGRQFGLEVTELFVNALAGPKSLQAFESIATRIARRARALYIASNAPPAHVSVRFMPGADLGRSNREATARAIATFVAGLQVDEGRYVRWYPEDGENTLPDEIAFIHVLGVPNYDMGHWVVPRAGWVAPLTDAIVQTRIDQKALCLPAYREVIQENWLLLVSDRTRPSQLFDLGDKLNPDRIHSPFSRTFFFAYPEDVVLELGGRGA